MPKETDPIRAALKEYIVRDFPGAIANPRILAYFKSAGASYVVSDETPWCAAFCNYILAECGLPQSGGLTAQSFKDLGIKTDTPQLGDIVILGAPPFPCPWGHVGFFIARDANMVYILGGNQNSEVCIAGFPISKVFQYRTLTVQA